MAEPLWHADKFRLFASASAAVVRGSLDLEELEKLQPLTEEHVLHESSCTKRQFARGARRAVHTLKTQLSPGPEHAHWVSVEGYWWLHRVAMANSHSVRSREGECIGSALYRVLSQLNHSCDPNCAVEPGSSPPLATLRVLREIHPTEELTISYLQYPYTEDAREELWERYGFHCSCCLCAPDTNRAIQRPLEPASGGLQHSYGFLQDALLPLSDSQPKPTPEPVELAPGGCIGRRAVGLAFVLLNQVLNVASGELMQRQEDAGFDGPYFSVWFNHSFTGLCCFVAGVMMLRRSETVRGELVAIGFASVKDVGVWSAILVIAYKFNVFWSAALPNTSVTVFMAISQCSCVIVLLISAVFLKESITPRKLSAVAVCLGGVALVCLTQRGGSNGTTVMGLLWTCLCTIGQAVYNVLWGQKLATADNKQVLLFRCLHCLR